MATHLPDPALTDALPICPACGYSLEGVRQDGPCPECGVPVSTTALVLYGVPRGIVGTSRLQRFTIVITLITLFFLPQLLVLMSLRYGPVFGLTTLLGTLIIGVGLYFAWRGKRSGATCFVFSPGGIGLQAVDEKRRTRDHERVFFKWAGDEQFRIIRIGKFWRNLIIRSAAAKQPILEAGIRCPDDHEPLVRAALERILAGRPVAEAASNEYHAPPMNSSGATTTRNDSLA